jgi:hypothetical protein
VGGDNILSGRDCAAPGGARDPRSRSNDGEQGESARAVSQADEMVAQLRSLIDKIGST